MQPVHWSDQALETVSGLVKVWPIIVQLPFHHTFHEREHLKFALVF